MLTHAAAIGLRSLTASPLRTILATLGVTLGTAALVAVLAVGDGVEAYAREQVATTTDILHVGVVPATSIFVDQLALPRPDTVALTEADRDALRATLPAGTTLSLVRNGTTTVRWTGLDSLRGASIQGADGHGPPREDSVAAGRSFTAAELAGGTPVAVVSRALARTMAGDDAAALGHLVEFGGTAFTVVGVAADPDTVRLGARVPLAAYERAVPPPLRRPAALSTEVARIEDVQPVLAAVRSWTAARAAPGALMVQNRTNRADQVREAMLVFKLLMGAITGISLVVGGIGIMNVLLASVFERTREIGIRRATGARRRDILGQFLAESVAITGVGSGTGLAVGLAAAFGISALIRTRSEAPVYAAFTPTTLVVAACSAVIIGLVFGAYPALRASRLSPIDAIRTE